MVIDGVYPIIGFSSFTQQCHDPTAWQFPSSSPPYVHQISQQTAQRRRGRSTDARRAAAELTSHRIRRTMLCMKSPVHHITSSIEAFIRTPENIRKSDLPSGKEAVKRYDDRSIVIV